MVMMKSRWIIPALLWLAPGVLLHAQPGEEGQRYRLAQGYEQSGDLKNAARVYRELYDADPQSNVYYEGVRRTYMAMLRYQELLPVVEERARRFSSDVDLRTQYADLLHRNHRRDEALREWQAAIELRPDDEFTYALVAQSQIDNRLFDLASQTYQIARNHLDPEAFASQLAQLYGILGRYAEATEEYLSILDRNGAHIGAVMGMMGTFTTNPKGADAAIAATRARLDARPGHGPYLDILAWLYTEKGDYEGAFDVAKQLDRTRNGRGSDIYAFADRALREGRYDAAIAAFEYFQSTYPKDNPLYGSTILGYAQALEGRYHAMPERSAKDAGALVDRYRNIVEENAGSPSAAEALMRIARLQADDLDAPKEAIATIGRLRSEYPTFPSLPEALLLQGDLHLRMGDPAKAGELYAAAAATDPAGENERYADLGKLRRGEILFHTGKFTEASAIFDELSRNSGSEVTNDALGYQFLLQENMGKNDSALAHYAAGSLLLLQEEWKRGMGEMDRVVALDREGGLSDDALLGKARAQEALGDTEGAVATLTALVEKFPDGTVADRALFHAAELTEGKLGERAKAVELYTKVLADYPASAYLARARERVRALRGDS